MSPLAYAPLARSLAQKGYTSYIVRFAIDLGTYGAFLRNLPRAQIGFVFPGASPTRLCRLFESSSGSSVSRPSALPCAIPLPTPCCARSHAQYWVCRWLTCTSDIIRAKFRIHSTSKLIETSIHMCRVSRCWVCSLVRLGDRRRHHVAPAAAAAGKR